MPPALPKGWREGTDRVTSPRVTFDRVIAHAERMGITRVSDITGLDRIGIPVALCCRPNSRGLAVSQGKGLDLEAARTSALMESVESWHAERPARATFYGATDDVARDHRLVDLDALPRPGATAVRRDVPTLWTQAEDLLGGPGALVPYELITTDYALPRPPGRGLVAASTSGLASGNHPVEALVHALCELVERDACHAWNRDREHVEAARRVDPRTVEDPACRATLERYAGAGVAVGLWELTSDIGLPVFACVIVDARPDPLRPTAAADGAGCHPRREVALLRALTEAAQSRLTQIVGAREDMSRAVHAHLLAPATGDRVRRRLRPPSTLRDFAAAPTFDSSDLQLDLLHVLGRLQAAGLEQALTVDLSRPEYGIAVVRAVVPGLRSADAGAHQPRPRGPR